MTDAIGKIEGIKQIEHPGQEYTPIQQAHQVDHTYKVIGSESKLFQRTLFAAAFIATLAFPPVALFTIPIALISAGKSLYNSNSINAIASKVFNRKQHDTADLLNNHIKNFEVQARPETKVKLSQQWQNFKSRLFSGESAKTETLIKAKQQEISQAKEFNQSTTRLESELETLKNEQAQINAVQNSVPRRNVELNAGKDDEEVIISELLFHELKAVESLDIEGRTEAFTQKPAETIDENFFKVGVNEARLRDLVASHLSPRGIKTRIENLAPDLIRITHIKTDNTTVEFTIDQELNVTRMSGEIRRAREDSPVFSALLEFCQGNVKMATQLAPLTLPSLLQTDPKNVKISLAHGKGNTIEVTHKDINGQFVTFRIKASELEAGKLNKVETLQSIPITYRNVDNGLETLHFSPRQIRNLSKLESLRIDYKQQTARDVNLSDLSPSERPQVILEALSRFKIDTLLNTHERDLSRVGEELNSLPVDLIGVVNNLSLSPVKSCVVKFLSDKCLFSAVNHKNKPVQLPGISYHKPLTTFEAVQAVQNRPSPAPLPLITETSIDNLDEY